MTRIADLLHSLTAIIVRYHDRQVVDKLVAEVDPVLLRAKAKKHSAFILNDIEHDYYAVLEGLIKKSTEINPERTHFLHYILNEIAYLKSMNDHKKSFLKEELELYKTQITRILTDFRQLLVTNKTLTHLTTQHKIGKPDMQIDLAGLVNAGYMSSSLCFSGELIKELLEGYDLSPTSSNEEIKLFAEELCTDHQTHLLVPELKKQASLVDKALIEARTQLQRQESRIEAQKETIQSLRQTAILRGSFPFFGGFAGLFPSLEALAAEAPREEEDEEDTNFVTLESETARI